MISKTRFLHKE